MPYPNLYIAAGTIMIAVGGLLATFGWNLRSSEARKDALVHAMASEVMLNLGVVADKKLTADGGDFIMFPRVHHVALDGALGSGLFTSKNDKQLLSRATELREVLVSLNQRLEFTENRMADDPSAVATFRSRLSGGQVLADARDSISSFGRLLVEGDYVDGGYEPFAPKDVR